MTRFNIISLFAILFFASGLLWYRSFADPLRRPVQGVDVSHHQGNIDWTLLETEGIDFAYIKATEGGDWVDPNFPRNWRGAERVGIARGAYHYFSTCRPGALQAENFLETAGMSADALPAALDLEYGGFCGAPPDRETLLREAGVWINRVRAPQENP